MVLARALCALFLCMCATAVHSLRCEVYSEEWAADEFARLQMQPHVAQLWRGFQERGYKVRDVAERQRLFMAALQFVNEHNGAGEQSYCLKPNHLATITDEEYAATLGALRPKHEPQSTVAKANVSKAALPATVYHPTGRVENQGYCGDCWAFAASHVLTGTLKVFGNYYPLEFSEQEICDCTTGSYGCGGGWSDKAYEWLEANPLDLDNDQSAYSMLGGVLYPYPRAYSQSQGRCEPAASTAKIVTGVRYAPKKDEAGLMAVVAQRPTTFYFDVENSAFRYYSHGVYDNTDPGCNAYHTNHAMSLVGYGTGQDGDYWHIKNSWGATWGMDGYAYVRRDATRCAPCGLCDFPLYPTVATEQ